VYYQLGFVALYSQGELEKAYKYLILSHNLTKEMGQLFWVVASGWGLGKIRLAEEAYDEAITVLEEALAIGQEINAKQFVGWILAHLAYAEWHLGRMKLARQHGYKALQISVEIQHTVVGQYTLTIVAILLADEGQLEKAIELDSLVRSQYPAADRSWYFDFLRRPLIEHIATLPAEAIEAARERGQKLDHWQTAESLLTELTELGWGQTD
jgi:tetratricopeptide (TPR) repeat protein